MKSSALRQIDDPATLFFFVWVVNQVVKENKTISVDGHRVLLSRGQMVFSLPKATAALHWSGYTEREVVMSLEKLRFCGLLDTEDTPYGRIMSLKPKGFGTQQPIPVDPATLEGKAMEVVMHHKATHPTSRGISRTGSSWKRLVNVLRSGYSVTDLKAAIDGNANAKWWKDKGLHGLGQILREEHLPRFISQGTKKSLADSWMDSMDTSDGVVDVALEEDSNEAGR